MLSQTKDAKDRVVAAGISRKDVHVKTYFDAKLGAYGEPVITIFLATDELLGYVNALAEQDLAVVVFKRGEKVVNIHVFWNNAGKWVTGKVHTYDMEEEAKKRKAMYEALGFQVNEDGSLTDLQEAK